MSKSNPIGWIGAGKMGGPMVRRLVQAGHRVLVLDPDAANVTKAVDAGAQPVRSIAELTESSTIFLMIPDDAVLETVVLGDDGLSKHLRPGAVVVEMSTVSPAASRKVAAELKRRHVEYLRAPVSGSTAMAEAGTLSVMVSGPDIVFTRIQPLLTAFSARQFYVGDAEQARYLKLVVNTLVAGTASLLSEAIALGRKGDIDIADMLEVICQSAVASPLIRYKRDMIASGDFSPAFTVSQMMKDLDIIVETARQEHVPMYVANIVRQQFGEAYVAGKSEHDFFVLCQDSQSQQQLQRALSEGKSSIPPGQIKEKAPVDASAK